MPDRRTCTACQADLPSDSDACPRCGSVPCWDCGSANGAGQAFCRRCGVWLVDRGSTVGSASVPIVRPGSVPVSAGAHTHPVQAGAFVAPPGSEREAPLRGRRGPGIATVVVALAAVMALAAVAGAVGLWPTGPATRSPLAAAAIDPTPEPAAEPPSATPFALLPVVVSSPMPQATRLPVIATVGSPAPVGGGSAIGPIAAPAIGAWSCGDEVSLDDSGRGRWSVSRVSFRAMDGFERVVLHLDREASGVAAGAASARASAATISRAAPGRATIGVDLRGSIRSALALHGYRPEGLRLIRGVSIDAGSRSRVVISAVGEGCFRMRAPAWESGRSTGADSAQLVVDVRR